MIRRLLRLAGGFLILVASVRCSEIPCRPEDGLCDAEALFVLASSFRCTYDQSWYQAGTTDGNPDNFTDIAFASVIEVSPGILFAAGFGTDSLAQEAGLVMRSSDGGVSWVTEWVYQPEPGNAVKIWDMKRANDGTLVVLGTELITGSNERWFLATKRPGQPFSSITTYDRDPANSSAATVLENRFDGGFDALGTGQTGTDAAGIVQTIPSTLDSWTNRLTRIDGSYAFLSYSAIAQGTGGESFVTGIATDNTANYDLVVGSISDTGTYTDLFRTPIPCCATGVQETSLQDSKGILDLGQGQFLLAPSPGAAPVTNLRSALLRVTGPDVVLGAFQPDDRTGLSVDLAMHGNAIVWIQQIITASAPNGTPQIWISRDGGSNFYRSFPADTDLLDLNSGLPKGFRNIRTFAMLDGSLLTSVPIDSGNKPSLIYKTACR